MVLSKNTPNTVLYKASNYFLMLVYESIDTSSDKPIIHFSHANSFPAASYRQLFEELSNDFQVIALAQFGHNPDYPVNRNWDNQVKELISFVSEKTNKPVYSVGHSFGGVVAYKAACMAPTLFSGLLLLDPPLITGNVAWLFRLLKRTKFIDKVTPSGKSSIRTTSWPLGEDLIRYFSSRTLFSEMPESVIQDYINAAIRETDKAYELSFDAAVETALFRNIPHDLSRFGGTLKLPATLVTAERSHVCKPYLVNAFLKRNVIEHRVFKDVGHLFPLDAPTRSAKFIKGELSKLS